MRPMWHAAAAAVIAAAAGCAGRDTAPPDPLARAIDSLAAPYVSSGSLSGVVAVTRGSRPTLLRAYGRVSFDSAAAAMPDAARFMIGSITKSFTAAAVLAARRRGEIDLDVPVSRYLPAFPYGDRITTRHLLTHQSGLANLFFLPDYAQLAVQPHTAAQLVALVGRQPLAFPPGRRAAYNNVNYTALAWLLEAVSGRPYGDVLAADLLRPLGLFGTAAVERANQAVPGLVPGGDPRGMTDLVPARFNDPSVFLGSGAIAATALDLTRWLQAIAGGSVAVGPDLAMLVEFARLDDEFRGRRALSTSGWDGVGYSASALYLYDDSLTVAVLLNVNISGVAEEVARAVAALALGLPPEVEPVAMRALPMDSLERLAGAYRFGDDFYVPRGTLQIVARDGGLYDVGRRPEIGFLPLTDGGFLYRSTWSPVRFQADADGRVRSLTFDGRFRAVRVSDAAASSRKR